PSRAAPESWRGPRRVAPERRGVSRAGASGPCRHCAAYAGARPEQAGRGPGASAGVEDVDDEDQRRAARDRADLLLAVPEVRRDDEEHLAAHGVADDAGVPALDQLPGAHLEAQRHAGGPRGVELGAVPQPAAVLGEHLVALLNGLALALDRSEEPRVGQDSIAGIPLG